MAQRLVTVFGGSGFIGRYIVQRLARRGAVVRVAVRDTEGALFLKPMGDVGQIAPMRTDITDPASVTRAVEGADAVINAVSLYVARGKRSFASVHELGARTLAQAAAAAGVERLVHISGIGSVPSSPSAYARSRAMGEKLVRDAFPAATILRPSVVFGPEDALFNTLAAIARLSPVMPLFGIRRIEKFPFIDGGFTKFQPVYVGDVADAAVAVLDRPEAKGAVYELGGPKVYSYRELVELTLAETGRKRTLVPVPFWKAAIMAWFLEFLPSPPLTRDQVKLLKVDNLVSKKTLGLSALGITPTAAEAVLPRYLDRFRRGGRFSETRAA
jgi:uncharacterized protein YbjT (DUF2867 family)